jgi:two-component sensor histidine kinase
MTGEPVTLTTDTLEALLPFHIRWSAAGSPVYVSQALRRFWQFEGAAEQLAVTMTRPFHAPFAARLFENLTGMTLDVHRGDAERILRVQVSHLGGEGGWLLVGSPLVRTISDLRAKGLAPTDLTQFGVGDLLIANEAAALAQAASERAARDLAKRSDELEGALREKTSLLQEVHHRVKNNLQIISSLLALQTEHLAPESPREPFVEATRRVRAIALTHEMLYGMESLAQIDLGDYARRLCEVLRSSIAGDSRIDVLSDPVFVTPVQGVPAGLVLNELITNALKYGRGVDGAPPAIQVTIRALSDGFSLSVRDHGRGLPEGFNLATSDRLGLTMVRALGRQLGGHVHVSAANPGTCFTLFATIRDAASTR